MMIKVKAAGKNMDKKRAANQGMNIKAAVHKKKKASGQGRQIKTVAAKTQDKNMDHNKNRAANQGRKNKAAEIQHINMALDLAQEGWLYPVDPNECTKQLALAECTSYCIAKDRKTGEQVS